MKYKCIIPCAGYGTRMNMSSNESKEMLLDSTGKPLIQYSLDICKKYGLDPLIITRAEKETLVSHCLDQGADVLTIKPQGEWMDTILASSAMWENDNIVLLPDTRFSPEKIVGDVKNSLDLGALSVLALHKVDDVSKWGSVEHYRVVEKTNVVDKGWAWGIMGFKKAEGMRLLEGMRKKGFPMFLNNASFLFLDSFKDVTRTGKIEV